MSSTGETQLIHTRTKTSRTVLRQEGVHKTLVCLLKIMLPTKPLEVFDYNSTVLFGIQLKLYSLKYLLNA